MITLKPKDKELFEYGLSELLDQMDEDVMPEQLSYLVHKLCDGYLKAHHRTTTSVFEAVSAVEAVKYDLFSNLSAASDDSSFDPECP